MPPDVYFGISFLQMPRENPVMSLSTEGPLDTENEINVPIRPVYLEDIFAEPSSDRQEHVSCAIKSTEAPTEEELDDDVFEVDLGEMEEETKNKWWAIARYYSSKAYNVRGLFAEMSRHWGLTEQIQAKNLNLNRFMLEFNSEKLFKYVTNGGPWKHKGDALIVVPYDGWSKPSEVCIESISLWVRIHDMPPAMIRNEALVKWAGAVKNYLRLKIDMPLAEPLKPKLKPKGRPVMEFDVKYEGVPHFCFECGRIIHDDRECPDEGLNGDNRFGTDLRASPQKAFEVRNFTIPVATPSAAKALNFRGSQRDRVLSAGSWSHRPNNEKRRQPEVGSGGPTVNEEGDVKKQPVAVPPEIGNELAKCVSGMKVDDEKSLSTSRNGWANREFVSLGSLTPYSDCSNFDNTSKHEVMSPLAVKLPMLQHPGPKGRTAVKKVAVKAAIGESIKSLQNNGMLIENKDMEGVDGRTDGDEKRHDQVEETLAKRSRTSEATAMDANNLVGAQGEPHQEQ
ncbi:hypothetical protein EJB05_46269, partial [Eragrostis curvula]